MTARCARIVARLGLCVMTLTGPDGILSASQQPPQTPPRPQPARPPMPPSGPPQPPKSPEPVQRLGENLFRVGNVRIDMARREISVPGRANDVQVLEFIANTKGGFKAYESALELDTNAINFNLALILIGLDKDRAVRPQRHFDPTPPQGDPVEIWVEWQEPGRTRTVRAEQLVFNEVTKQTLPEGAWVYTGSVFVENVGYLADLDGVLIGFVHTPAPVIENPSPVIGPYGANRFNPSVGLRPGTPVTLTVRALDREKARHP